MRENKMQELQRIYDSVGKYKAEQNGFMQTKWKCGSARCVTAVLSAVTLSAAVMLTGCGNALDANAGTETQKVVEKGAEGNATEGKLTLLDVSDMFSNRDKEIGYDESECEKITLLGNTAESDSGAVQIDGSIVTITKEGIYLLTGELQGQLVVNADKKDKIQLVMDGVSITNESSAALYVSQADKVFVTTAAGSTNKLETTGEYVAIDEHNVDGAVYARDDITFNGEGSLQVVSATGNGLVCKDDLVITSGSYEITAGKHGVEGKDSVRIANGDIVINAAEDGIHSGNDEDDTVGYTYIAGGDITLTVGDDGIHSDTQLVIAGGKIRVTESYEGLEGLSIEIAGGEIDVKSSDDGLNAAGGNDGSGMMGRFGENPFAVDEDTKIIISGGKVTVDADGDGIDSNGNLYVSGGEVVVYGPSNSANGALDYDGSAEITGGSVIALGARGMAQNFGSDSTQCSMLVTFQSNMAAGTTVELKDETGKTLLSCTSIKSFDSAVLSCGELQVGKTYTVTAGSESLEVEMTETIYGGGGMGGFGPGGFDHGGRGGGGRDGGKFRQQDGEMPRMPDGQRPELPDGEMPQMPDGERPEWSDGEMPQMPEGETPRSRKGRGKQFQEGESAPQQNGEASESSPVL